MKRADIRAAVEQHLDKIGIGKGNRLWQPALAQLVLVIGSRLHEVKLRSGISRRALMYELGRIAGLAEAEGVTARKANGAYKATGFELAQLPA